LVGIWSKQHESMHPTYLESTVKTGGGGVIHCLNATSYLNIVADHIHSFISTIYPSSKGYLQLRFPR
uniref:Uncharacterized protein n=1 Tax=Erpetoichthys calabaricus TaxID=27687 RepID=A0A8C4SAG6_ERPCA